MNPLNESYLKLDTKIAKVVAIALAGMIRVVG